MTTDGETTTMRQEAEAANQNQNEIQKLSRTNAARTD